MTDHALDPTPSTTTEPNVRHVRVRLPDPTYRALRHLLADAHDPNVSISDVIVELLDAALAGTR